MKNIEQSFGKNLWLSKRQVLILLVLILTSSILLRTYKLDDESLWHDEAFAIGVAKKSVTEIIGVTYKDLHPPLHYIMLHYWIKIFGDSETSTRFLSVIFGVLSIYVIYRLGDILFNKEVGIISAAILSISLYHIQYSQETRSYSLLVLMALLSNYYFVKFLKEKNAEKIGIKNKNILKYIVSTVVMAYTHVFGLFYIIFQNIYYFLMFKKNIRLWITVQSVILLLFSPWIPFLYSQMSRFENKTTFWTPSPGFDNIYDVLKLFSGSDIGLFIFSAICIVGLIILYKNEKLKSYRYGKIFVLSWLFIPIVLSFTISQVSRPIFYDRYLIASLPAFVLLTSYAIFNHQRILLISALLISVILVSIPYINGYYQNNEKEQWREVAKYIDDNKKEGDIILLYPVYGTYGFNYYHENSPNPSIYVVNGSYEVKNQIRKNPKIWLITTEWWNNKSSEESRLINIELSKTHTKKDSIDFIDIDLSYYEKLDVDIVYLYQKDSTNWKVIKDSAWGKLTHDVLSFTFDGHKLIANADYTLVYTDKFGLKNNSWMYIARNMSDYRGDINMAGNFNICGGISNEIFVRLILSKDYDTYTRSITNWDLANYLFEDDTIICDVN